MDSVSQLRLAEIFPALAERVHLMAAQLRESGIKISVVQALRTWAEQDALYANGRDENGEIVNKAAVVTNCRGGMSYHNFGLAVDCVPSTHGPDQPFDPDWNSSHPIWQKMIAAGQSVGLTSGATWRTFHDFPHFQLTGRFPEGEPSSEVHELYRRGGLRAVWEEVANSIDARTKLCGGGAQFSLAYETMCELDRIIHLTRTPEISELLARQQYWDAMRLDEIKNQNVAAKIFDMAVNMGVHQAAVYAQRAANGMITAQVALPVAVGSAAAARKTSSGQSGLTREADTNSGQPGDSPNTDVNSHHADAALDADVPSAELKPLVPIFRLQEDGVLGNKSLAAINALDPIRYYQLLCDLSRQHYIHVASINPAQATNLHGWLKRAAA